MEALYSRCAGLDVHTASVTTDARLANGTGQSRPATILCQRQHAGCSNWTNGSPRTAARTS
jgi:hypothetical protein